MSNYIKQIDKEKFFCLDDFFGPHKYGYVQMTWTEKLSKDPWNKFNYGELEHKGGTRKVYTQEMMRVINPKQFIKEDTTQYDNTLKVFLNL